MLTIKEIEIGNGVPKVIVPLVGVTENEILQEAKAIHELKPDVVEWRVDKFEQVEDRVAVQGILGKLREILNDTLLLFTFRSHKEGGSKEISDSYYLELNKMAIKCKDIDLVDIELFKDDNVLHTLVNAAKETGVYVIMSNHDFTQTPSKDEIVNRLTRMKEFGADIPKIAVMPTSVADVLTLLDATNAMKTQFPDVPLITMSMGGQGVISRVAGELFGSAFTFGAGKEASAPGQIPVAELRTVLKILHNGIASK